MLLRCLVCLLTPPVRAGDSSASLLCAYCALLQLLKWLLARLRPRDVDANKQYASEILAILVQQSGACDSQLFSLQSPGCSAGVIGLSDCGVATCTETAHQLINAHVTPSAS